jgi:two-component system phosphate regulon sensor histidine kinase PhoR
MLTAFRRWSTGSRRLGALFLMVLVPSAATLVWLGVQLVEQDRRLWADRDLERRESAADIITRALGQQLAAADAELVRGDLLDGALFARFNGTAVAVRPSNRVLWLPTTPHLTEANVEAFAEAEIAEIRETADRGLSAYTALARSRTPAVRAGALLRLARVHRSTGDVGAAIKDYRELARFTDVAVAGMPADLLARREVCELLQQTRETASLAREAEALRVDLLAGRWPLDRSGWAVAAEDIERWTGHPIGVPPERQALTAALEWLWKQHAPTVGTPAAIPPVGRHVVRMDDISILILWRSSGYELRTFILPPAVIDHWAREAMLPDLATADALVLTDDSGTVISGLKPQAGTRLVTRPATETGLPWNVTLKPAPAPRDLAELTSRRRLLGAGLGAIVVLISGGSYLLWRTVRREMALARIQTEFVAAVSHEFRTPLTSLQHVTELLDEDDELPQERRQSLYAALARSTERLRGLVESLLDFARMEDGRKPYDLRLIDPSALVSNVIGEFERQFPSERTVITRDLAMPGTLSCRADVTALGHALWNLLDNAVKYSTEPHLMTVSVGHRGNAIAIAVADQGFGIPAGERQSVFQKFIRGSGSVRRGIKGTGLGLAMVSHIIAAHGGRIELETEEGHGSTFTILLPAAPAADSCLKTARAEESSIRREEYMRRSDA